MDDYLLGVPPQLVSLFHILSGFRPRPTDYFLCVSKESSQRKHTPAPCPRLRGYPRVSAVIRVASELAELPFIITIKGSFGLRHAVFPITACESRRRRTGNPMFLQHPGVTATFGSAENRKKNLEHETAVRTQGGLFVF